MALAISVDQTIWRADSVEYPRITSSGYTYGLLKIGEEQYVEGISSPADWHFLNKSNRSLPLIVREGIAPTWTHSGTAGTGYGPLAATAGAPANGVGAYDATALNATNCSIEGRVINADRSVGISLQNGDATVVHDYTGANAKHAMYFQNTNGEPFGQGTIWEAGSIVTHGGYFQYALNDKGLIEKTGDIVRYYLVKPDYSMILLRTTRSKLTAAPKAEVKIYGATGSAIDHIITTSNDEASTTIEIIGVLENFQDWKNDFFRSSNADAIQMANNEPEFTYPNPKKRLRSLSANLASRSKTQALAFEAFFDWHGMEKEFLFVDKAKTDANSNPTEWWARFSSPLGDKTSAACIYSHQATITESYRRDYIPKLVRNE